MVTIGRDNLLEPSPLIILRAMYLAVFNLRFSGVKVQTMLNGSILAKELK